MPGTRLAHLYWPPRAPNPDLAHISGVIGAVEIRTCHLWLRAVARRHAGGHFSAPLSRRGFREVGARGWVYAAPGLFLLAAQSAAKGHKSTQHARKQGHKWSRYKHPPPNTPPPPPPSQTPPGGFFQAIWGILRGGSQEVIRRTFGKFREGGSGVFFWGIQIMYFGGVKTIFVANWGAHA